MPRPEGSLGRKLDLAYPAGSLPSHESNVIVATARAARAIGCPRIRATDAEAARACELAPLFLGGSTWEKDAYLSALARQALTLAWIHACADRLLNSAPHLHSARLPALYALEQALTMACELTPLIPADALTEALHALGAGSAQSWPCAQAARTRLVLAERSALDSCCAPSQISRGTRAL